MNINRNKKIKKTIFELNLKNFFQLSKILYLSETICIFFYPREHRATVDDHFYPIRNSQLVDEKKWTWFPPRGQSRRPRQRGWGSSSPLHHSPSAPPNTTQDRLTPRYSEIVANRARLKLEQIQRIYLDNKPDTTCTIYSQYSQAHINASATAVTGSVFMRRFRLFLGQCVRQVPS